MARDSLIAEIESDALDENTSIATALRKCVSLGSRSGSERLRDWATAELQGYGNDADDLPRYRTVGAPLNVDAFTGNAHVTNQVFPPSRLPEFVEDISDQITLRQGISEIEQMGRRDEATKLMPSMAADLVRVMNAESENPYQQITALYWSVSPVALRGVVDQVRTALVQLVAELREHMPRDEAVPSAAEADQAVNVVVTGKRSKVSVTTAQAADGGTATVAPQPDESGFWTRSRKIVAFIAGLAGIVVAVLAVIEFF